jgi:hypothetical protein
VVIAKQQTFRHKIKIFRKNGKSCDIVSEKSNKTREIEQIGQVVIVIETVKTLRCVFYTKWRKTNGTFMLEL